MASSLVHRRLWLGLGGMLIMVIVWLSLAPPGNAPGVINDKLSHAIAYFALSSWFCQLYARHGRVALAAFILGSLLELMQGLSGYRDMSFADLLADTVGIALGVSAARRFPTALAWLDLRLT